jgi:hypothetical protein
MDESAFLRDYLQPSQSGLQSCYTHSMPDIPGLAKAGDFIVQAELEGTYSVNILRRYLSSMNGFRLVEVYKNSQNRTSGNFVRLVGSLTLVKEGYPFLLLDASIRNVNPVNGQREELTTRVAIHLPQATPEQARIFFDHIDQQAKEELITSQLYRPNVVPPFWGQVWVGTAKGVNFNLIRSLRDGACHTYRHLVAETGEHKPFDYAPFQQHMVFTMSKREHGVFKVMGLSVPAEAQAAFFSIMVSAF